MATAVERALFYEHASAAGSSIMLAMGVEVGSS